MSVTFWCPTAPRHEVPCPYCAYAVEQGYAVLNDQGIMACESYCNGTSKESDAPEVQISNEDVGFYQKILGLSDDLAGQITVADLPGLVQRINLILSQSPLLWPTREATCEQNTGGPKMWDCGLSATRFQKRVEALQRLFAWAAAAGYPVTWG